MGGQKVCEVGDISGCRWDTERAQCLVQEGHDAALPGRALEDVPVEPVAAETSATSGQVVIPAADGGDAAVFTFSGLERQRAYTSYCTVMEVEVRECSRQADDGKRECVEELRPSDCSVDEASDRQWLAVSFTTADSDRSYLVHTLAIAAGLAFPAT